MDINNSNDMFNNNNTIRTCVLLAQVEGVIQMAIPFKYPDNTIESIIDLMQYANEIVGGLLGPVFLIIIGFIAFVATKRFGTEESFGYSSFILLFSAILLRLMELISDEVLLFCVVLFIGGLIMLIRKRNIENFGT